MQELRSRYIFWIVSIRTLRETRRRKNLYYQYKPNTPMNPNIHNPPLLIRPLCQRPQPVHVDACICDGQATQFGEKEDGRDECTVDVRLVASAS